KKELLGVSASDLETHGAVSETVALAMAEGALRASGADIAVSVTGIAGPGGSEFKPEGRVCFGLAAAGRPTRTETVEFGARGRDGVRRASTDHALALLIAALGR
ncbi:MAG: nicotinamide-nucleotide amidohydrolase family protein, partial [Rhodobacteraceae bacterium]|nr:nicotinamide-nucleotide amidohydrolase family protein [Paracoccaceae bacterium]